MIENITKDNIGEYRDLLALDIVDEVANEAVQEDGDLVVLGFREDEVRKGTIAAVFEYDGDILIRWVYVKPQFRRKHIATQLLDAVLRVAAASSCFSEKDADIEGGRSFSAELKLVYAKPENELQGFEEFLRKVGFTDIVDVDVRMKANSNDFFKLRSFEAEVKSTENTFGSRCVTELKQRDQKEIAEISGGYPSLEYCFVSGKQGDYRTIFIVEDIEEKKPGFKVYGAARTDETSLEELLVTVRLGLYRMKEKYPDGFDLYIEKYNDEAQELLFLLCDTAHVEFVRRAAAVEIELSDRRA